MLGIRTLIEKTVRNFAPGLRVDKKSLRYMLWRRAIEASAELIETKMPNAQRLETREQMFRFALSKSRNEGLFLEFGVHNGHSINAIAKMIKGTIHGFDSFEGLPDDGIIPAFKAVGTKWYGGKMSNDGVMPEVESNVVLHKGWFDELLPNFFLEHQAPIAFMHIDCDIYSSTKTVLEAASSSIVTGTVLLFDEYLNYEGWQANEHRAFMEFVNKSGMQFEFIALTYSGAVAVQVTRPGKSVLEANSDNLT